MSRQKGNPESTPAPGDWVALSPLDQTRIIASCASLPVLENRVKELGQDPHLAVYVRMPPDDDKMVMSGADVEFEYE